MQVSVVNKSNVNNYRDTPTGDELIFSPTYNVQIMNVGAASAAIFVELRFAAEAAPT